MISRCPRCQTELDVGGPGSTKCGVCGHTFPVPKPPPNDPNLLYQGGGIRVTPDFLQAEARSFAINKMASVAVKQVSEGRVPGHCPGFPVLIVAILNSGETMAEANWTVLFLTLASIALIGNHLRRKNRGKSQQPKVVLPTPSLLSPVAPSGPDPKDDGNDARKERSLTPNQDFDSTVIRFWEHIRQVHFALMLASATIMAVWWNTSDDAAQKELAAAIDIRNAWRSILQWISVNYSIWTPRPRHSRRDSRSSCLTN